MYIYVINFSHMLNEIVHSNATYCKTLQTFVLTIYIIVIKSDKLEERLIKKRANNNVNLFFVILSACCNMSVFIAINEFCKLAYEGDSEKFSA